MDSKGERIIGLKTIQLNDQKAGMEGLDKETINKIIYETSKGTPYFAFQEKRQKSIDSKVRDFTMQIEKITSTERKESLSKMDALCRNLENNRDLSHSIVHIDMDAFYAAVEMHDNPNLKNKPVAVGSSSMLSTSNYIARKYGVRAAMPGFIAKKLCPNLIIIPCNFDKYRAVSNIIQSIVEKYDPLYCASSLDEVYLDLTEYIKERYKKCQHENYCLKNYLCDQFVNEENIDGIDSSCYTNCLNCAKSIDFEERDKMAYSIVEEIRSEIFKATELTASAGIAVNTMLAKVCSDQNKPNGQYQIPSTIEAIKSFIATLPVKKVSGIGPVQGQILNAIGIYTCADLWTQRDLVAHIFTSNSVDFYMRVCLGMGNTTIRSDYARKSIGNERTFREIYQAQDLHKMCKELCSDLTEDLKLHNIMGKVVILKIKTTNFQTYTRNHSMSHYTADFKIIHRSAKKLLDTEIAAVAPQPLKLRLMGIRMCNLLNEDSISNHGRQQITLKNFLQLKTPNVKENSYKASDTFTCPMCLEIFDTPLKDFNDHVNNCLNYSKFNEQTKMDNKSSELTENSCENQNSPMTFSFDTCSENIKYFCPVCELNLGVKNLLQLNNHIDSCLNRGEIKKILSDDFHGATKRKYLHIHEDNTTKRKVSRREKKIYEYFK